MEIAEALAKIKATELYVSAILIFLCNHTHQPISHSFTLQPHPVNTPTWQLPVILLLATSLAKEVLAKLAAQRNLN
jgi:hypothetical protein